MIYGTVVVVVRRHATLSRLDIRYGYQKREVVEKQVSHFALPPPTDPMCDSPSPYCAPCTAPFLPEEGLELIQVLLSPSLRQGLFRGLMDNLLR